VGNGNALNIVVHKNIRLQKVTVSDFLDSDHLPIVFHILHHVRTKILLEPLKEVADWNRFKA
jgi:hypothetical protein